MKSKNLEITNCEFLDEIANLDTIKRMSELELQVYEWDF